MTSGDFSYEVYNGGAIITGYSGNDTELIIPNKIDGYLVEKIRYSSFAGNETITSVTISDSVTTIESSAFYNCKNLERVNLGKKVTEIQSYAFENCVNLKEVYLGSSVTTIGYYAFEEAPIEKLVIPKSVTSIGSSAFTKVKEIVFEEGMLSIPANACSYNTSLTKVTIPNSVTKIQSSAFSGCTNLVDINMGNAVEIIESYAFYNVPIERIIISKKLTSIGSNNFTKVKEIIFEEGIQKIPDNICSGATGLTKVIIPDSVTEIGTSAFDGCTALNDVNFGTNLESIGNYAFDGCTALQNVTLGNNVTSVGNFAFNDCTALQNVVLGNVKTIGKYAFGNCARLDNLSLGNNLESIGEYAFYYCKGLENLTLPDSLTSIGYKAFYYCVSLKNIALGDALKKIGYEAFYNCTSLEKVELGNDVNVDYDAFRYCTALSELVIGDNCVLGNRAFGNCTNIKSITIGENATFGTNVFQGVTIGGPCSETGNVRWSVDIESKTLMITGSGEMKDYTSKSEVPWLSLKGFWDFVNIEEGVTSISSYCFEDCDNLTSVTLPVSLEKIGSRAFFGCDNISYIELQKKVQEIGSYAFAECSGLTDIVFCGNAPIFEEESIPNKRGVTAYYPETGSGWISRIFNKFTNVIWKEWDNTMPSNDIVLVLDRSGSMYGRMDKLKEASIRFLQGIGGRLSNTRVAIVEYDDVATVLSDFSTDKMDQINKIQTLTDRGGTEYQKALRCADDLLQNSKADFRSIVMFSDGEPNDSESAISALAESLRQNYNIYTVGLISNQNQRDVLIDVAGFESHYFEVDDIDGLLQAFLKLLGEFGKKEYTTVELKRNDNRYDLLKEEHAFCIDSPEQISIYITPGTKYAGVVKIALEQDGKQILVSTTGNFENIIPGNLFTDKGDVYVVLYDSKNNVIESLPLMVIMKNGFKITYHMNDDSDTDNIYLTNTIINGMEIEEPEQPVREGYDFNGWYSSKECTGYDFFSPLNYFNRIRIEDDITLYAKWKKSDKNFNITEDAWSFINNQNAFDCTTKEISVGDYQALTQNLDNSTKDAVEDYKNKQWNGSCFGMSSSAVLLNSNVIRLVDFDANYTLPGQVTTLYHNQFGDADVGNIESMINYYHLRQVVGSIASLRGKYDRGSESKNIENIINKLKNSKYPVVLTLSLKQGNVTAGGHAVVAYDLKYDEEQKTYTFSVYDCSLGNGTGDEFPVTITENNGGYTKSCDAWEKRWQNSGYSSIFLKTALTKDELQQEDILKAPSVVNMRANGTQQADYYILNTEYSDFTISNGTQSAEIVNGEKLLTSNLNIECLGLDSEVGEKPIYKFYLPVLNDGQEYTISSQSNGEFVTSILYSHEENGFFSSVESASAGDVTIASNGKVTTKYNEAVKQTIKLTKNKKSTPWYNVTISGEDTGFCVDSDENEMKISSDNKTKITLLIHNDFNNLEFKDIEVDNSGIIIENNNGSCVIKNSTNKIEEKDFGYSVVFNSQCGTSVDTLVNVAAGTLISEPKDIKRDGYIFEGWFKEKECVTLWDFGKDKVTEDTVLYAGWSVDENYFVSITFKVPGHENQIIYLPQGSKLPKNQCPVNTASDDKDWYTEDTYENKWDYNNGVVTSNITLYGKGKLCTITFETGCDTKIESYNTYAGKYLEEPNVELVRDGFTLCGWTTKQNGGKDWKFGRDKVMDNTVLYARWVKNEIDGQGTDTKICIDIGDQKVQTYTGKAIKPQVVVRDGNVILKEGKDYKVSYKNNTKVCKADDTAISDSKKPQVIVQGINAYKSSKKFVTYFSIEQADMADLSISVPSCVAVKPNGKLQKIKTVVKTSKITVPASNYTISYYTDSELSNGVEGITAEGVYYVVVEAKKDASGQYVGSYKGKSKAMEVTVLPKELMLSSAKIVATKKFKYIETPLESDEVIAKIISKVTIANTNYVTAGAEIENFKKYFEVDAVDGNGKKISQRNLSLVLETAGKKTVTLRAKKGNEKGYAGEVKLTITVEGKKLNKNQFKLTYDSTLARVITSVDYTGQVLVPIIHSDLRLDQDYTVTYKYNSKVIGKSSVVDAGNYTAVITGINKYSGKIDLKFKINKVNLANAFSKGEITISGKNSVEYSPNGTVIKYSLYHGTDQASVMNSSFVQLVEGKDFTVSYKNNKKATTSYSKLAYTVIQGKGNYTGSIKGDGKSSGNVKKGIAKELNFYINRKPLSSEDIKVVVKGITQNGKKLNAKVVLYDGGKIIPSKEYTNSADKYGEQIKISISYNYKNKNRNYDASRNLTIPADLIKTTDKNQVLISLKDENDSKCYYTGEQFKPEVIIQNANMEDISSYFTIEYGENTKVGKGTITITGNPEKGYCESKTLTFVILPKWAKWLF